MIGKETASARVAWAHHNGKMHMISSHLHCHAGTDRHSSPKIEKSLDPRLPAELDLPKNFWMPNMVLVLFQF
jgi:hypothetical protein